MIFHTSVPLLSTAVPSCIIYSPVYGIYIKILHCLLWYFVSPVQRHTIIVSHQHFGKQKCIVHQHFGIVIRLSLLTLTGLINRPMEKVIFVMFQLRPQYWSSVSNGLTYGISLQAFWLRGTNSIVFSPSLNGYSIPCSLMSILQLPPLMLPSGAVVSVGRT